MFLISSNFPFVNLLNSHLDNPSLIPNHYETDDQNLDVEQCKERRKWTPKEDVVLISAWLNTSKDLVIGNEQKAGAFWKRIESYFNSSAQLVGLQNREAGHCKLRWGRLNDQVCKFVGCFEAVVKEQSSGQNENDVIKATNEIFFNDHHATLEEEGKSLSEFQRMGEIKQQDNIVKEKLSKNKLLDSLFLKSEPLSDIEIALKNKLIGDMLS